MTIIIEDKNENEIMVIDSPSVPFKKDEIITIFQDVQDKTIWSDDITNIDLTVKVVDIKHSIRKTFSSFKTITEHIVTTVTVEELWS